MNQHEKNTKINSSQIQIPIRDQSKTLPSLYAYDLKYMFPWSQYDPIDDEAQNYRVRKTENEENIKEIKQDLNDYSCKNTLRELNNFSSKIEFLQSKIRNIVGCKKCMDTAEYYKTLEGIVNQHEQNLIKTLTKQK